MKKEIKCNAASLILLYIHKTLKYYGILSDEYTKHMTKARTNQSREVEPSNLGCWSQHVKLPGPKVVPTVLNVCEFSII